MQSPRLTSPNPAAGNNSVLNVQPPRAPVAYANQTDPNSLSSMLAPISIPDLSQLNQEVSKAASIPAESPVDEVVSPVQWKQPTGQPVGIPVDGVSSAGIPLYPRRPLSKTSQSSTSSSTAQPTLESPVITGTVVTPRTQLNLDRTPTSASSRGSETPTINNYPTSRVVDPSATQPRITPASAKLSTSQTYFNAPAQECTVIQGGTGYDAGMGYGVDNSYGGLRWQYEQ